MGDSSCRYRSSRSSAEEADLGIGWIYFEHLERRGVFGEGAGRVLDIGAQNIFDIPIAGGVQFLRRHGSKLNDASLERHVRALARQSGWPPRMRGAIFLGEFLADTALEYLGLDIFPGTGVEVFDLNFQQLPEARRGTFDVVLNFGTTEHVFNQYNCFKVIHDAARIGGYMFHQLPCSGYMDHGYWVYSPRVFADLAEANGYELCEMWCSGPQGDFRLFDRVKYHPAVRDRALPENAVERWEQALLVNGLVNVLLRKQANGPFRLGLDVTTSVGDLDAAVFDRYAALPVDGRGPRSGGLKGVPARLLAAELWRRIRSRISH